MVAAEETALIFLAIFLPPYAIALAAGRSHWYLIVLTTFLCLCFLHVFAALIAISVVGYRVCCLWRYLSELSVL
jgi:uncharacterized membrane protein YqaE (UPF0057 family)